MSDVNHSLVPGENFLHISRHSVSGFSCKAGQHVQITMAEGTRPVNAIRMPR